jgi:hypothetical protein
MVAASGFRPSCRSPSVRVHPEAAMTAGQHDGESARSGHHQSYSITSSAPASSASGTGRPSALAEGGGQGMVPPTDLAVSAPA